MYVPQIRLGSSQKTVKLAKLNNLLTQGSENFDDSHINCSDFLDKLEVDYYLNCYQCQKMNKIIND